MTTYAPWPRMAEYLRRPMATRDTSLVFGAFIIASWVAPLASGWRVPLQAAIGTVGVGYVLWSIRRDQTSLKLIGLCFDNIVSSTLVFVPITLVAVSPLLLSGANTEVVLNEGSLRLLDLGTSTALGFPWAFFQQFIVIACFWRLIRGTLAPSFKLGREARVAGLAAGLFGLTHAPNVALTALVFAAEFLWLLAFARFRNLFALALAHAVAAVAVSNAVVPSSWLHSMRTGLNYWQ